MNGTIGIQTDIRTCLRMKCRGCARVVHVRLPGLRPKAKEASAAVEAAIAGETAGIVWFPPPIGTEPRRARRSHRHRWVCTSYGSALFIHDGDEVVIDGRVVSIRVNTLAAELMGDRVAESDRMGT